MLSSPLRLAPVDGAFERPRSFRSRVEYLAGMGRRVFVVLSGLDTDTVSLTIKTSHHSREDSILPPILYGRHTMYGVSSPTGGRWCAV
eukprot:4431328-Pyramimonas_sp.AAC.1